MNTKHLSVIAAILFTSTACAINTPEPVVSNYNGDSVKIQATSLFGLNDETKQKMQKEASRICSKGHKKKAEYVSSRFVSDYVSESLFLCLN